MGCMDVGDHLPNRTRLDRESSDIRYLDDPPLPETLKHDPLSLSGSMSIPVVTLRTVGRDGRVFW